MKIVASDGSLNAISLDNLFASIASLHSVGPGTAPQVEVDLGAVQFVEPYGVVGLIILLETIARRSKTKPRVITPRSANVCGYLARLGAWSEVRNLAELDWDSIAAGATGEDSDVLLELTAIRSQADIDSVLAHLQDILTTNLGYSSKSLSAVLNVFSELCHNVLDHSETVGWVVAQRYYSRGARQRFVRIGVGDTGIGIKASLGKRHKTAAWSHFDAIVNALKKDVSSLPNRGLGLHVVERIINEFDGALDIRTGDCRLYLGKQPKGIAGAWFPGTQVGIVLTERQGA
ncbi:MAG: ATP-binding protein [Burkholderiales bacterium]